MNRFRTKKNKKEASDESVRPSIDSVAPSIPTVKPSKTFRLGRRKEEPEPTPAIDLSTALPSSDDFRTSLLMSGLSARFSMLREQDDPKSKIGKASDDSVLFPKRQSRLGDFGFQSHGLTDIAEVSSINGSIRPPFAVSRTGSYRSAEDYGTDNDSEHSGSIMNRSKPGEGNNLFGGRQKVTMGNRTLYESDVNQSAFQKLREREREELRQRREREQEREDEAQASRADSPPLTGYNRNRETSSTTSSNGQTNARTSTAATSFTSQSTPSLSGLQTPNTISSQPAGERLITKTRRLYETGLDSHRQEQQISAMSRIDTLTRQRNIANGTHTPPPGVSPTFTPSQAEKWGSQMLSKQSMPNLRGNSPPPSGSTLGTFDFGVRSHINQIESKPFGMTAPPLSPPVSEHDEVPILAASVQPNDRGKATALGAFSKPVQPYDDNKYSQRQLQMQQGRETPPLRKNSPARAFAAQQQQNGRTRAESNSTYGSGRSRSSSSVQRSYMPDRIPESQKPRMDVTDSELATQGTFFLSSPDRSPSDTPMKPTSAPRASPRPLEVSTVYPPEQNVQVQRPPESQHPMHRSRPFDQELQPGVSSLNPSISSSSLQSPAKPVPADSPTLGPATTASTGLSGMIRNHLRSDSNSSSIYGGVPSVIYDSRFPQDPMQQNDYSSKSNPWETADWDDSYYIETAGQNDSTNDTSATSPQLSIQSPSITTPFSAEPRKPFWEKEMGISHNRDGSTATQKEQQDFKNDLANRRRLVQENMKSYHENDSRSASPMRTPEIPRENSMKNNALGLLKKKSGGSLAIRTKDGQSKAMKMLGIGSATTNSSATSPGINSTASPGTKTTTFIEDNQFAHEDETVQGVPKPLTPPGTRAFRQARRELQRDRERQVAMRHQQNIESEAGESDWPNSRMENQPRPQQLNERAIPPSNLRTRRRTPSRERKPPPVTYNQRGAHVSQESKGSLGTARSDSRPPSSRERSESDASGGRSKSRNGGYRDDLAKAMAEGLSSSSQPSSEDLEVPVARLMPRSPGTPNMNIQQSPMPSPRINPNARSRSNSRTGAASYFDSRGQPLLQTGALVLEPGMSPRPSPSAPFVVNPTPPLVQPGSGATTPVVGSMPTKRKASINKSDISDPIFISTTSRVTTVNLPPGASLQNGVYAPPIPPVNPRRRQTRAMFGMGRKGDSSDDLQSLPAATQSSEEMSTFSGDEVDSKPKAALRKLRKSSSEGGNMNARARQVALAAPSPAMPGAFPAGSESPPRVAAEGGMF